MALRLIGLMLLLLALLSLGGCIDTLAEAMLAPESLAAQGLSGSFQAVSQGSLGELQQASESTAAQLDQILNAFPEAANRPELADLRDQLGARTPTPKQGPTEGSITQDPERRARFDRRVDINPDDHNPASDDLVIKRVLVHRRPTGQLPVAIDPTELNRWDLQQYVISPFVVRVH